MKRKLLGHKLDLLYLLFVNKRLNLGHRKMFEVRGKGPGKSWNFKVLKWYEPCV